MKNNTVTQGYSTLQKASTVLGSLIIVVSLFLFGAYQTLEAPAVPPINARANLQTTETEEFRDGFRKVDKIYNQMSIDYPGTIKVGDSFLVTLMLSAHLEHTKYEGETLVSTELISDLSLDENSTIYLNASAFEVAPAGGINKPNAPLPTTYVWTLTPKSPGEHYLLIELNEYTNGGDPNIEQSLQVGFEDGTRINDKSSTIPLKVSVASSMNIQKLIYLPGLFFGVALVTYPIVTRRRLKSLVSHKSVFISYRRKDDPYASRGIRDALVERLGSQNVYFDIVSNTAGQDYRSQIEACVQNCTVMLVVIGDNWLQPDTEGISRLKQNGDWVRVEIATAIARGIPVIPVLVGQATMPEVDELPDELQQLVFQQCEEVRPTADFENQLKRLIANIEQHL